MIVADRSGEGLHTHACGVHPQSSSSSTHRIPDTTDMGRRKPIVDEDYEPPRTLRSMMGKSSGQNFEGQDGMDGDGASEMSRYTSESVNLILTS